MATSQEHHPECACPACLSPKSGEEFELGWRAGLRGVDPRMCPYPKMSLERKRWRSCHRMATIYAKAHTERER